VAGYCITVFQKYAIEILIIDNSFLKLLCTLFEFGMPVFEIYIKGSLLFGF
jgi:hypothetical protein